MIGRWSELPIFSASLQDVFTDQLLPQREMSGVLSLPVIRLVRDEMRASHKDLLSVQKSMEIEGWVALVSVQDSADSMAAASSS